MTVYVDDMQMPAKVRNGGRVISARWSHLFADSELELVLFAELIGLRRQWIQRKPSGVHFDVTEPRRQAAIRAGAVAIECGSAEWMRVHQVAMEQFGTDEDRRAAFRRETEARAAARASQQLPGPSRMTGDVVRKGAWLAGPAGHAQEVIIPTGSTLHGASTTVAVWFLTCPGQSPAWQHYLLSAVHLRDSPGVPPPVVTVPSSTHEVLLIALNPKAKPTWGDPGSWAWLLPFNVHEQVQVPSDAAAMNLVALAARAVVDGVLWAEPPLSGQIEPWRVSLIQTAAHLRGERHAGFWSGGDA